MRTAVKRARKLTAIDLFCGCGGLTLGLRRAGFRVLAAIDNDPLSVETYRKNHKRTRVLLSDIDEVDESELMGELDLAPGELGMLAGCPPCQGFSTLRTLNGGRKVADPMNDLIFQFVRFIKAFRPKAVMIENVPGLAADQRILRFGQRLRRLGYDHAIDVFNAVNFGVPQRRRRMILTAIRDGEPQFATPIRRKRTVKGAIARLPSPGKSGDPAHDYIVNRKPHVLDLIKRIPKDGGSRMDLGGNSQLACHRRCDGFKDIYGRMSWSEPAPTITGGCINPSKGRFLHPEQDRAITVREAAMLQGFPKTYVIDMSKGRYPAAQMIGNAFPPKVAEHHARKIFASLMNERQSEMP